MKKLLLIHILLLLSFTLVAPPTTMKCLYLPAVSAIKAYNWVDYEPLANAIAQYETGNNPTAYNRKENAVGAFQIRQCRINHYNELTGAKHTLKDCYDYNLSKRIFIYFAQGKSYETAARNWNGSGPMTIEYWKNVKRLL